MGVFGAKGTALGIMLHTQTVGSGYYCLVQLIYPKLALRLISSRRLLGAFEKGHLVETDSNNNVASKVAANDEPYPATYI
jgi:hypothetical protein